jgi:hypothetical protein
VEVLNKYQNNSKEDLINDIKHQNIKTLTENKNENLQIYFNFSPLSAINIDDDIDFESDVKINNFNVIKNSIVDRSEKKNKQKSKSFSLTQKQNKSNTKNIIKVDLLESLIEEIKTDGFKKVLKEIEDKTIIKKELENKVKIFELQLKKIKQKLDMYNKNIITCTYQTKFIKLKEAVRDYYNIYVNCREF